MIGTVLGNRYEILELVGTGGMANVYKAKCTLLNRNVAIKVLKEEFRNDEETIKRFNIESQAVAGLSHTNIVSVFDVGTEGDMHYIVMEYAEGITLKEYLKESGALTWDKAIDFAIQVCSALQHAHRKGIVHRDIKPQNIMVTKDDVLKVMDFGIARAASTYTAKIDNEAIGTAHYCSPEQAKGSYTDERSDIYSLGVVMYEMLTGRPPFESDSSVSVALKQIQEKPVPLRDIVPSVPVSVEALVLKAMEKDAVDRFQTANTLLIELNWIKQTETAPKTVKYAPIEKEDVFATKKISVDVPANDNKAPVIVAEDSVKEEVDSLLEDMNISKTDDSSSYEEKSGGKNRMKKSKQEEKEDKKAVIAAIISSIIIVSLLGFFAVNALFGDVLWSREESGEMVVPDVVGCQLEEVKKQYKDFEFIVESEEISSEYSKAGVILSQTPEKETVLTEDFKIKVVISKESEMVKVPDVVRLDLDKAKSILQQKGILYRIEEKASDEIPEDIVMAVSPAVGTKVKANSDYVTLTVSSGDDKVYVSVPNVVGKSETVAKKMLEDAGLSVTVKYQESSSVAEGEVINQSQPSGSKVVAKESVIIYVSKKGSEDSKENDKTGTSEKTPVAREITVYLPSDKDKVEVEVTLDGKAVYRKTHNTSEGAVSVVVRGTGTQYLVSYVDGVVVGERSITFN